MAEQPRAAASQAHRLALQEPQPTAPARPARELELPPEPVLYRLAKPPGD